jgi:sterol desaturase/sphingolipid hydroxylase (fatty acid hydroxylase superfamily)
VDKSVLIFLAIPVFYTLMIIEFTYGVIIKKNTYRLNDTFVSISIGLISRFPVILNLGFNTLIFSLAATTFNLKLLPLDSWVTWVVGFVLYDLTYYVQHRLHHEIKLLWATHIVHHHGEEFNLSTALRQTSTGWLWKWMFYIPMIVIGVPAEVFITVGGLNLLYKFWVHTEHIQKLGFIEKIFVTPSNHRVHHAKNPEYIDANYGGVFILWDRMFGTYIEEKENIKPVYGTVKALESWNPIWANIEVFYNMLLDSVRTKKWSDKIKVWYAPTYWRPEDVAKEYPSKPVNLKTKYNPKISTTSKIYVVFQMIGIMFISNALFSQISTLSYQEIAVVSIILTLIPTLTGIYMQNNANALLAISIFSLTCIGLILWSNLFPVNSLITQAALILMLINLSFVSIHSINGSYVGPENIQQKV